MNSFTRSLCIEFVSGRNMQRLDQMLRERLIYRGDSAEYRQARAGLRASAGEFSGMIARELMDSESLVGLGVLLHEYNCKFVDYYVSEVRGDIPRGSGHSGMRLGPGGDCPPTAYFSVGDGGPGVMSDYGRSPDELLTSWKMQTRGPTAMREDTQGYGTVAPSTGTRGLFGCGIGASMGAPAMNFCDQSSIGLNQHVDAFETPTMRALNAQLLPHERTAFGVSTPAADSRLLARRDRCGIPDYEKRLYRRPVDRNIDEALAGTERGHSLRGHDMADLYARINHNIAVRNSGPGGRVGVYRSETPYGL
jgi:hypothetical protein